MRRGSAGIVCTRHCGQDVPRRQRRRRRHIDYGCRLTVKSFDVRTCRPHEVQAVLELWREARSDHASTADRLSDVRLLVETTPGSLLVADADGVMVGTLIAAWDGWRGNMYRLAVDANHRRRGIGLALVRAGEEHLRQQGAARITALVAYEDEVAAAFWEAAGYPRDLAIGRRVRNL
jgi:ribosomal protein S18 acetylase RimI-like enzyme